MDRVLYDGSLNRYYCVSDTGFLECASCKRKMDGACVIYRAYRKKEVMSGVCCSACFIRMQVDTTFFYVDGKVGMVCLPQGLPKTATEPCSVGRPAFRDSAMNVFDAASPRVPSDRVSDKTVLAGRESWEGVRIGSDFDDGKDKKISKKDAFALLDDALSDSEVLGADEGRGKLE